MRDYYPITLIKTNDLDPQRNYIFGYHPHGLFVEGATIPLVSDACGFSEKFPGIVTHLSVHSGNINFGFCCFPQCFEKDLPWADRYGCV